MRRIRALALPLAAQALFSAAQVSVTLVGAALLQPAEWGRIAILLAEFFVVMAAVRGAGSLPVLVHASGDRALALALMRPAMSIASLMAVPGALTVAATGWGLGDPLPGVLLGIGLVGYARYEAARSARMAAGMYRSVVIVDAALLVVLVAGSLGAGLVPGHTYLLPFAMSLAYCATAVASGRTAVEGSVALGDFVRRYRRDMPFLALDGLLMAAAMGAFVFIAGALHSVSAAGRFRTAVTLLGGPLQMMQNGLGPLVLRALRSRALRSETGSGWRSLRLPLAIVGGAAVAGGLYLAAVLVPGSLIFRALGWQTLLEASALAVGVCALTSCLWIASVWSGYARYRSASAEISVVRAVTLLASLVGFAALAALGDLNLAAIAGAIPWFAVPAAHALARARRVPAAPEVAAG